jgi:hypothetical protein
MLKAWTNGKGEQRDILVPRSVICSSQNPSAWLIECAVPAGVNGVTEKAWVDTPAHAISFLDSVCEKWQTECHEIVSCN